MKISLVLSLGEEETPADGVRVVSVQEAPPQADGRKVVAITVQVAADAAPGERALTIAVPGSVQMVIAEPRDAAAAKEMQRLLKELERDSAERVEVGALQVNTHDLEILDATQPAVRQESEPTLVLTVSDAAGDISAESATGSGRARVITQSICNGRVSITGSSLIDAVQRRDRNTTVITAPLARRAERGCELNVRVRDEAGNMSDWFPLRGSSR